MQGVVRQSSVAEGMKRTFKYAAMTKDEESPAADRMTFFKAVIAAAGQ
jgi:hypothetical protein